MPPRVADPAIRGRDAVGVGEWEPFVPGPTLAAAVVYGSPGPEIEAPLEPLLFVHSVDHLPQIFVDLRPLNRSEKTSPDRTLRRRQGRDLYSASTTLHHQ